MFAKKVMALLVMAGASSVALAAAPIGTDYTPPDAGFKSTLTRAQVAPSKVTPAANKLYGFVEVDRGFVSTKSRAQVMAEQAREPKHYGDVNYIYFGG